MSRPCRSALFVGFLLGFVLAPGLAMGQGGATPVVTQVFPPGATIGLETDWKVSGRNLSLARSLLISGGGVDVVGFSAQGEDSVTVKVRVAASAEPGFRELRVDGPSGISNLAIVRIDRLKQVIEVEKNQTIATAQPVEVGTAVAGILKSLDRDHYGVSGKPGQKVTIDLEARRIGTAISPVMTIFGVEGNALAQGREMRGPDRDCLMSVVLPADGLCVVQVRDNTYGGNDQARYRLRVDPFNYATAVFPIGGIRGQSLDLEVSGGNLSTPLHKRVTLPDRPGTLIEPGIVEGPNGPVLIPGRIAVGEGPEISEPADRPEGFSIEVRSGMVVNGRLAKPGEIDGYKLAVKAGEKIRLRVEAAAMGSWIDPVVAIRDSQGGILAENDDSLEPPRLETARSINGLGLSEGTSDASLDYEAKAEGVLTIEVVDRFSDGGPEYAYRLTIGPDRPDFAVTLLLARNTGDNPSLLNTMPQPRNLRVVPGQFGVFNLKPGASVPINFLIRPEGRPGPVELSIEGLPEGVTAEPVKIRFPGPKSASTGRSEPVADFILLKVASFAQPCLAEIRIVARASPTPGVAITRLGSAAIAIDTPVVAGRPLIRVLDRFPLRIIGETRPRFVGPPEPPRLLNVGVSGPLLQGDRLDLKLEFSGSVTAEDGSTVEARADGVGLATNTVISSGTTTSEDDEKTSDVMVHVLASTRAELGLHPVKVSYKPPGGTESMTREVMVEVKVPIEVKPALGSIYLRPGDQAAFRVEIRREVGFDGEVEIKLEGLPRGVKSPKNLELAAGVTSIEIKLDMNSEAKPIEKPSDLRVVGIARMPRGNVSVESKIRPMIEPRPADK